MNQYLAEYIGPVAEWRGEPAILTLAANRKVMVQFSNLDKVLERNGVKLQYGWHEFDHSDWQIRNLKE